MGERDGQGSQTYLFGSRGLLKHTSLDALVHALVHVLDFALVNVTGQTGQVRPAQEKISSNPPTSLNGKNLTPEFESGESSIRPIAFDLKYGYVSSLQITEIIAAKYDENK